MKQLVGLLRKKPAKRVSVGPHTKVVHFWNKVSKTIIWAAALVTLLMLALIVGYILVNGLYTRKTEDSPVLPQADKHADIAVLVPRSLRTGAVDFDTLRNIYGGTIDYWGFITGQDRNVTAYLLGESDAFVDIVDGYLFGESDDGFAEAVQTVQSMEVLRDILREERGAIAIVPSAEADGVSGSKRLGVRDLSVVVHPTVTELVDGVRVRSIEEETLRKLLTGEIRSWGEVRASQSLGSVEPTYGEPVRFIALKGKGFDTGREGVPAPRTVSDTVDSVEGFAEAIRSTPGAIGVVHRRVGINQDLSVLNVRFVTHSANLRPSFFWQRPSRAGEVGGISTIIVNTLVMIMFVLMIATPIGVAAAIYIVEYAKQGRLLMLLRVGTDTLAGVPSIIFGLFGLVFFSQFLGLQTGLLSGSLTLTIMILPTVVRAGEEALRSVPYSYREGSLALGATRIQTLFRVVLPSAAPGILTGVVLGIGRAIGETAAVLFTMGSNLALIRSVNSPIRVLSVHLYMLVRETISIPNAFATATILVLIVLLVNTATHRLIGNRGSPGS